MRNKKCSLFVTVAVILTITFNGCKSDRLDQIIDTYKDVNAEKAEYLKKAFEQIKICSIIFLLFIIKYLFSSYLFSKRYILGLNLRRNH